METFSTEEKISLMTCDNVLWYSRLKIDPQESRKIGKYILNFSYSEEPPPEFESFVQQIHPDLCQRCFDVFDVSKGKRVVIDFPVIDALKEFKRYFLKSQQDEQNFADAVPFIIYNLTQGSSAYWKFNGNQYFMNPTRG